MNRPYFIGFYVTKSVRDRIHHEAKNQGFSVSQYMFRLLLETYALSDDSNPSLEDMCKPDRQKKTV